MTFMVRTWQVVVSTHALLVVAAVVVGTLVAMRRAREPIVAAAWLPVLVVAALVASHLLHRAFHGGEGWLWSGGLSSMGGVAGIVLVVAVAARGSARRFADLADAVAPAAIVALGIGRIGCFLGGCCWGEPTDLPWGVVFPELGPPARHPLQLYSAALDFVLAGLLLASKGPPGATAARAALGFGVARLLLEVLRDPAAADVLAGGLRVAHAGALILCAGGIGAMVWLRRPGYRLG